ncbi:MAG: right-handed parallel beta-helix repeat-containing protein, partial [Chlamydiota bacterium]
NGNVISGNDANGISIVNSNTTNILSNRIGTDSSGSSAIGNSLDGVFISGSDNTNVGGNTNGDGNIISGNLQNGVAIEGGDNNQIIDNNIGLNAAGNADLGNTLNGVSVSNSTNTQIGNNGNGNVISGNDANGISIVNSNTTNILSNRIGTDSSGSSAIGNSLDGVFISGSDNTNVGGNTSGDGNLISGNNADGVHISNNSSTTSILGNLIGTNATGLMAIGNSGDGVEVNNSSTTKIGDGTDSGLNVISGNEQNGVYINNLSINNTVQGNYIGTDATGLLPNPNVENGIRITNSFSNLIGGYSENLGNTIAYNGQTGVWVESGDFNGILTNSIFSNGELGIDLVDKGVDPNDLGDPDLLANLQQNYPVLTYAVPFGDSQTILGGTINTLPNLTFTIQFFRNMIPDPSGFGEGRVFVTSTVVSTDGSGNASFEVVIPDTGLGDFISSTATDPFNNTSEFSGNIQVSTITFPSPQNPLSPFPFIFVESHTSMMGSGLMASSGNPWGFLGIDFKNQMTSTGDNIGFSWLVPYQNFLSEELITKPVPSTLYINDRTFDRVTQALDTASETLGIPTTTAEVHESITELSIDGPSVNPKNP